MIEMVERVVKAIMGEETGEPTQYEAMARAAIEAMRKPTEAMVKAGLEVRAYDGIGELDGYGPPADVYEAMIKTAMK